MDFIVYKYNVRLELWGWLLCFYFLGVNGVWNFLVFFKKSGSEISNMGRVKDVFC